MDILLYILGFLCIVLGLAGSVLPALPGPPLSYVGMLLIHFTDKVDFTVTQLVVWGVLIAVVQVLDFIIPNIGVIVGMFAGPAGIVLGPFVGAVIGEMLKTHDFSISLKAGFGAFLGFLAGTLVKVVLVIYLLIVAISSLF